VWVCRGMCSSRSSARKWLASISEWEDRPPFKEIYIVRIVHIFTFFHTRSRHTHASMLEYTHTLFYSLAWIYVYLHMHMDMDIRIHVCAHVCIYMHNTHTLSNTRTSTDTRNMNTHAHTHAHINNKIHMHTK
jgi:hypothetical protein